MLLLAGILSALLGVGLAKCTGWFNGQTGPKGPIGYSIQGPRGVPGQDGKNARIEFEYTEGSRNFQDCMLALYEGRAKGNQDCLMLSLGQSPIGDRWTRDAENKHP